MAFNDNAVFTASTGYVYLGAPGTAAPTPAQLDAFDPDSFGAHSQKVEPSGDTFVLTVEGDSTEPLAVDSSSAQVQAALEQLASVGVGNAMVRADGAAFVVYFIGDLFGKEIALKSADSTVTVISKPAGWSPIGHTGNEDLPEFGYEGGDSEAKGSWQKKNLKEVVTESPVDYVTVKALQFDPETLELYYGKNASTVKGVFGVDNPASGSVERSVLIVIVDGSNKVAFAAAKASVRRDESITLATDEFSTLPLRATFIKHPGRHLFEWITQA